MGETMREKGRRNRTEVLGADHVERATASVDDFDREFQDMLHEYAWGFVWSRDGISRRDRSMLNIALLTTLGRNEELAAHLRGALTNGVTREEIREVLMHTAIYAGVPAAVEGFRVARHVLDAEAPGED